MTGDWQEDWAEGPEPPHLPPASAPASRGRHGRPPQDYGEQDPYTPADGYPEPDPYATPAPYGQPDPYSGPDRSGPADPLTAPGRFGPPDPLTAPGRFAPDPLTDPGRFGPPDPLTAPGRFAPPDPLTAPGRFAPPDPLTDPGRFAPPDPLTDPGRSGPPDPYATRPHRVPAPPEPGDPYGGQGNPGGQTYGLPGYPADEPYGGRGQRTNGSPGRGDQNGHVRGDQNGHARTGSYDPLTAPPGGGYGPPGFFDPPAGRGGQNGHGTGGYPQPDDGPFRWRPAPEAHEPEGLAPLPGYHGGPDREPPPAPRDWDPPQERDWDPPLERDWDPGADDSVVGLAEPASGPVDGGAWQREADERGERDEPRDWEDTSQGGGLIPGFGGSGSGSGSGSGQGRGGGRPRRRVGRVLAPLLASVLALVLLAALGVGGFKLYRHFQSADYTGPGTGEVTVQVMSGDTATSLAPRLVKLGVVASTSSFISAAKNSSNPDGLEPGFFRLRHHMNAAQAYALLLKPSARIQSVVTIPEGLRETEILAALEQKTGTPASAFTKALKDTAALGLPSYAKGNPEGYLFPATYNFNPGTSALAMLQTMVARYNQEAASINLAAAAKTAQLTPSQVITVASILEAEAGSPKYYAEVAEVIYNRLNDGMFLGLDSTVNYALHRFGVSLTTTQLHVNSPYNTFIHLGLPPGPIDSPGNTAIEAALHPAHGVFTYFVTVNLKTGLTLFTDSPSQFQQFENECDQNHAC